LANNLKKGVYKVSVKDRNGCADSLTASVLEPTPVLLKIQSFTNALCNGNKDGKALAAATGGTGAMQYTWSTNPTQKGATANNLGAGTYIATATDAYGCSDTAAVNIIEPPLITVKISANRLAVRDIWHTLSATASPTQTYTYNWSPSTVFGTQTNLMSINGRFQTSTLVTVRATDAKGCYAEDTASIEVIIPFVDFIPTAFSPNGDNINDVFGLPDIFEIEQFDIYNRWGALLFKGSATNPNWNGQYEGQTVPIGTYMYLIKVKLKGTVYSFEHEGTISVLR